MMDFKKIKESGLLEQYLLDELSKEEQLKVEEVLKENKEARDYFTQLEISFEKMAQENAITPPAIIKKSLLKEVSEKNTTIKPLQHKNPFKTYLAIAASIVILLGISTFLLFQKINTLEENLQLVDSQNSKLNRDLEILTTTYGTIQNWYQAINDPNAVQLILEGNTLAPNAKAISYINHTKKTVVLNASKLPELPSNKDYQLWADVDGEMIDMGVITKNKEMLAMTYIENTESLNITIEPAGGNDHPTVANLIANVYL